MVPYIIYQFWTGDNAMSSRRRKAYESSVKNFGVPVKLLYSQDIERYILPEYPLHPIYNYLSYNHRSDYLRSYFLNFYGGGYADIKYYSQNNNWKQMFDRINQNSNIDIIGVKQSIVYPYFYDIKCNTITKYTKRQPIDLSLYSASDIVKMVCNSYFIVRPHSKFSQEQYKRVNKKCDQVFQLVKQHPAILQDTNQNTTLDTYYPLRWQELQRQLFHPLCCEYYNTGCVDNSLITGRQFNGYR